MAPLVRTGGSRHTGLAALPHRNIHNVHLEKRENKDYLVFGFEEVAEVCLNDDESQNNLKSIFVKLLTEITKYPIELQFLEKPEYKTGLYIDVCKEYIKDLNKEITNVRKNMPEKLKIQ